jgi:hypothetical protein
MSVEVAHEAIRPSELQQRTGQMSGRRRADPCAESPGIDRHRQIELLGEFDPNFMLSRFHERTVHDALSSR